MKFFNDNNLKKPWVAYTVAICSGVILYLLLSHLNVIGQGIAAFFGFVQPVLIGLVMAYVINPLAKALQVSLFRGMRKERVAWYLSVAFAIIFIILGIVILLVMLIPQLVESVQTLISNATLYSDSISDALENLDKAAKNINLDISSITSVGQDAIDSIVGAITKNSGGSLVSTVTGTISSIINGVISFIISIYFLLDKRHLLNGLGRLNHLIISDKAFPKVKDFWDRCNSILGRYIWCDLLDGLIIGCANAVFMLIGRMPYVALISVVVGVTNLAPTFGPIVGAAIGAFILVLNNPWDALWFLIFTICLQTCDGYILKPKMFGGVLNVPGVWILIMIIVFSRMFGVVGILVAIPAAAILNFIYHDYLFPWLRKRHERRQHRTENPA